MVPTIQKFCLGLFLGVLLVVGVSDAIFSWNKWTPKDNAVEPRMPRPVLKFKTIWSGDWTVAYESWLNNRSWLVHGSGAKYRELVFNLFGRHSQEVVVGKENWLFTPRTLALHSAEEYQEQVDILANKMDEINKRYNAIGMKLVILLIPNAANVFPEKTPDWVPGVKERRAFLSDLTTQMQARGILVLNASDAMQAASKKGIQVFFKGDHHWSYAGAQASAEALAEYLKMKVPEIAAIAQSEPIYQLKWTAQDWHLGSLNRKLGFWQRSPTDMRFVENYEEPDFGRLRTTQPYVGWFGTSFSYYGSPEFFSNALGNDVAKFARRGKGSKFAAGWGLKHYESTDGPKPIIAVLEMPEYHLVSNNSEGGFQSLKLGLPPWETPSSAITYKFGQAVGLIQKKKTLNRFLTTGKKASLQIRLDQEVTEIEVAMTLSETPRIVIVQAKGTADSSQICYDGAGSLKYRFKKKKPSAKWDLAWNDLEKDLSLEIGEIKILDQP